MSAGLDHVEHHAREEFKRLFRRIDALEAAVARLEREVSDSTVTITTVSTAFGIDTFTSATRPLESVANLKRIIYVKDPGAPGQVQQCLENTTGTYGWQNYVTGLWT